MYTASRLTFCLIALLAIGTTSRNPAYCQPSPQQTNSLKQNDAPNTFDLTAQLTNADGNKITTPNVTVFLCDAASGFPIDRTTKSIFSPTLNDTHLDRIWYEPTNDNGRVTFKSLPAGKYRLVAVSWPGLNNFNGFHSNKFPYKQVQLHGVADDVELTTHTETVAMIKPLGSHTLSIKNKPAEAHAILVVSLQPTLGDGILGLSGWGKEFCRHWIGVTQMEDPEVTISGLPTDSKIHVALINYDNNPGVAAATYNANQKRGELKIIATWSNGHKTPPANLLPLIEHIENHSISAAEILNILFPSKPTPRNASNEQVALRIALWENNDAALELREFGKARLADIIAAFSYIEQRDSIRRTTPPTQRP